MLRYVFLSNNTEVSHASCWYSSCIRINQLSQNTHLVQAKSVTQINSAAVTNTKVLHLKTKGAKANKIINAVSVHTATQLKLPSIASSEMPVTAKTYYNIHH